jgi:hypothetical protein
LRRGNANIDCLSARCCRVTNDDDEYYVYAIESRSIAKKADVAAIRGVLETDLFDGLNEVRQRSAPNGRGQIEIKRQGAEQIAIVSVIRASDIGGKVA